MLTPEDIDFMKNDTYLSPRFQVLLDNRCYNCSKYDHKKIYGSIKYFSYIFGDKRVFISLCDSCYRQTSLPSGAADCQLLSIQEIFMIKILC